jgi:Rieske Fe-S protein
MPDADAKRRRFLNYCAELLVAIISLLVAVPALGYVLAPLLRRSKQSVEGAFLDAGPLANLPEGEWRLVAVEMLHEDGWRKTRLRHAIWVRRRGEQDITVLSSICPHLGCPVNWQTDQAQFFCPCHGGIFDTDGRRTGGPPPRSMDPLPFEVRAGRLWVRWQDFKIGTADRVPVSI